MIQDPTELATLQSDWQTVRKMRDEIKRLTAAHHASAGGVLRLADYAHSLPVLLGFEVLRGVLLQLRAEGQFTCDRNELGLLMEAAKSHMPWMHYSDLRHGARRRNEIAHKGTLLERAESWQHLDHIEQQLIAWKVVS